MYTDNNRKLFSNFLSLTFVQGINLLAPLLVMPLVISKIGVDKFGVIAVAQVVMTYLTSVSDYGFNLTATRSIALYRQDKSITLKIFFTVLASKMLITTILLLLLLTIAFLTPVFAGNGQLYILAFTYVIGQALLVNWFFQGIEKMHFITICTLLSKLIFVVLVITFIRNKDDGHLFLFFFGAGNIIAGILSIFIAIHIFKLKFFRPQWADIIVEIKGGWQITVSNLSINTFLYSNIFILRIFTNDLIVGYYSIAERIFLAVRQVLSLFSQVIYPRICQLTQKSKKELNLFLRQFYLPFFLLVVAGCGVLFTLSPQIISVFIKDGATLPVLLLRILSFVPVIVCLNIPAYQILIALERKKSYLRILGLATIINIVVNIFLVNIWGATGTAISILFTELFITAGLNWELSKNNFADDILPERS
ncbi:MAG TPA: oligosaccharide flippase family protein [Chitinophagaceae bacterium]|nr:oligosaccharide flippase family protein [Chitinophagaceae bacterium]